MLNNLLIISNKFLATQRYCTFGFSFFSIYLALTTASWGENPLTPISVDQPKLAQFAVEDKPPITVPPGKGETITEIRVKYVDKNNQPVEGKTKPKIIIQEFDLQPGDIYDPEVAKEDLERVNGLNSVKRATLALETSTTDDNKVMVVTVEERNSFFFGFALTLPHPTALKGPARPVTVLPQSNRANGIGGGVRFGFQNLGGTNKVISLGVEGGVDTLGFDLDYREFVRQDRGYGFNFFSRQGVEPEFDKGKIEVNLPNGKDPWVDRLGGGGELFFPLAKHFQGAAGISYEKISVKDGLFSSSLQPVDELGNPLTVNDSGKDDLLIFSFAASLDKRNNNFNPTKGYRLLFGTDQSIPVGSANILYNRLGANYSQFLPLNLFGFTEGDRTLVLNIQGGTIIGDVPPYEAFSLGGSNSVRGFSGGELGTGRSFIQATAEYRFPIFNFDAFKEKYNFGGLLFVDYGTDLGSGDNVIGEPAVVRDKPGNALGYGLGARVPTGFGTLRLEFALNSEGGSAVYFNIGERF